MKKKMTLTDFRNSRVEMTPLQYCSMYLTAEETSDTFSDDVLKVHVYKHGFYIMQYADEYQVIFCNDCMMDKDLAHVEQYFWEHFAEAECNSDYNYQADKDRINSIVEVQIDLLYSAIAEEFDLEYGDVSPYQQSQMDEIQEKLNDRLFQYVQQNK